MTILDVWPNVSGFEAVRIELVIEVATHQGPTNVDLIIFNELKHPIIELSLMTRRKMHKNDLNDVLKYQLGNHPKDTGSLLPFTYDLRSHTISPVLICQPFGYFIYVRENKNTSSQIRHRKRKYPIVVLCIVSYNF